MKETKINDAIIGLKQLNEPIVGSISFNKPVNQNTVITIKTSNMTIQAPIAQIKLVVFKLDAETFGFIFQNKFLYDKKDFESWDKNTKCLSSHELQPNF
ncbi:hypothetical protein [Lactobacillus crispatus]|uniref:hypothetical protein n=1 Tax=Lactobacillus crispatus TaxID=47770 RepID=UPI0018A9B05B|nr:hypothetical protein [Lactobacillus crispatus]